MGSTCTFTLWPNNYSQTNKKHEIRWCSHMDRVLLVQCILSIWSFKQLITISYHFFFFIYKYNSFTADSHHKSIMVLAMATILYVVGLLSIKNWDLSNISSQLSSSDLFYRERERGETKNQLTSTISVVQSKSVTIINYCCPHCFVLLITQSCIQLDDISLGRNYF